MEIDTGSLREFATSAIKYWEPRRILYNAVLAAVVAICFAVRYPASKASLSVNMALFFFVLAILANVAYSVAYFVDIFVQFTAYRETWLKRRWTLFAIGLLFASVITRFWALGVFGGG